jgi:hypothetical protein
MRLDILVHVPGCNDELLTLFAEVRRRTGEVDNTRVLKLGDAGSKFLVEVDGAVGRAASLITAVGQNDKCGFLLGCLESVVKDLPERGLKLLGVVTLGVFIEGPSQIAVQGSVADTALEELEEKALHTGSGGGLVSGVVS